MANIISIDVSPNPVLKNNPVEITVTFDTPVRGLSATDFTDPNGNIENVATGEGVEHVFKFTPDPDYVGTTTLRLRGGGWWDVATYMPGVGQEFDINVVETLPEPAPEPPRILDFTVDPQNPAVADDVTVIVDFSESSTLVGPGILADGDEDLTAHGYDVASVEQEQISPEIYRWTIVISPNDSLVEGETLEFTLPAENYISNISGLPGENSKTTYLNKAVDQTPPLEDSTMTNHLFWHQGRVGQDFPNCGGCKEGSLPSSRRIAAEYARGIYTLTNVIYPYIDPYNYSNLGVVRDCLDKVKEGDVIYMVLVPPMHRVLDAAVYSYETMEPGSTLTSLAGMEVDLVTTTITGDGGDEAEDMGAPQPVILQVAFPDAETNEDGETQNAEQVFRAEYMEGEFTSAKEWRAYGIQVKKLPTGTDSLADIKAGIAVAVHVLGFDAQIQMG